MPEDQGGSVEVGGNGLCYTCGKNLAIPGGYNCAKCKGDTKEPHVSGNLSIPEIQKKLLEMARVGRAKEEGNTIFGYQPDDPLVKDLL